MKKLGIIAIATLCTFLVSLGCATVTVKPAFQKYKAIYVSWLDLGDYNYKSYGYPTQKEWIDEIKSQNIDGLQKYTRDYMRGWKVTGAESKFAVAPRNPETIVVKFTNVVSNNLNFSLRCEMDFYDGANGKLLKKVNVESSTIGFGYSNYSFGGRLMNAMYNLAYNIQYYLTH